MEKRLLLAIVLSFLVLFLYQMVLVKKPPPQEPSAEAAVETAVETAPRPEERSKPAEKPGGITEPPPSEAFRPVAEEAETRIVVETSLYRAVWINRGAQLQSWRLKAYKDENKEDLELVSALAEGMGRYPFRLKSDDPVYDDLVNTALYRSSPSRLELDGGRNGELRFEYADEAGNRVEKVLAFRDGTYEVDIQVRAWKNGQEIRPRLLWGPSFGNMTPQEMKQRMGGGGAGIAVYTGGKVYHHQERKYKSEESLYPFADWAAYDINYFTALFIAPPQKISVAFLKEAPTEARPEPAYFLAVDLPEKVYIGPKDMDFLEAIGKNTKKLIRFGFFGWIAEILLKAIKAVHAAVPNWGFSIIILTLIIKIIFFPLTYSSTKSMAKMQELQPKMKAIRAKYKKAKQDIGQRRKMNEEIMKLYKEHGVNPAGGCLPILIQIPIFWGFFRMLVASIEFRQSPFLLWIKDLSVRDPYYVTPILMGATQFISQKMTPTSADPTQQRMMLIMPVVMTIFFMNFQSGLVLYWLTNNILQIGQQAIMNRLRQKQKRESHGKKRRSK